MLEVVLALVGNMGAISPTMPIDVPAFQDDSTLTI